MEIGHTYVVLVPHRLPTARYPDRDRLGTHMWAAGLLIGARFRLTVTGIDHSATPVTAEGLRLIERSSIDIELSDRQAIGLGLPPGQRYRVTGSLVDRHGRPARVPSIEPTCVPVRWLRPTDDPHLQRHTHRDADHWPYM